MSTGMPFTAPPSPMPGRWQASTMVLIFIEITYVFMCHQAVHYLSRTDGNQLVQVLLLAPGYGSASSPLSTGRHAPSPCYGPVMVWPEVMLTAGITSICC